MHNPFTNDPFFHPNFGRSFIFTDPFELFNSLFGDLHSAFANDPFFAGTPFTRSPFNDPFFRTPFGHMGPFGGSAFGRMGDPFSGSMIGGSPFGGLLDGPMFPAIGDLHSSTGGSSRVYTSTSQAMGSGGKWISKSQTTRTINGRTEVITKHVDADVSPQLYHTSLQLTPPSWTGKRTCHILFPRGRTFHAQWRRATSGFG